MTKKLEMMSNDIIQENIDYISKRFPNALREVLEDGILIKKIDFEILKQELSDILIDDKQERYHMTWPDKKKSILLANTRINATLRPDKEKSVDFDNTKNIYIEGDNLEVLKLLKKTYHGRIKMIYIDPPYNTGKDFVYRDSFKISKDEYTLAYKVKDELGDKVKIIKINVDKNQSVSAKYGIRSIPTLMLFKDGQVKFSQAGVIPADQIKQLVIANY